MAHWYQLGCSVNVCQQDKFIVFSFFIGFAGRQNNIGYHWCFPLSPNTCEDFTRGHVINGSSCDHHWGWDEQIILYVLFFIVWLIRTCLYLKIELKEFYGRGVITIRSSGTFWNILEHSIPESRSCFSPHTLRSELSRCSFVPEHRSCSSTLESLVG